MKISDVKHGFSCFFRQKKNKFRESPFVNFSCLFVYSISFNRVYKIKPP